MATFNYQHRIVEIFDEKITLSFNIKDGIENIKFFVTYPEGPNFGYTEIEWEGAIGFSFRSDEYGEQQVIVYLDGQAHNEFVRMIGLEVSGNESLAKNQNFAKAVVRYMNECKPFMTFEGKNERILLEILIN